MRTQSQHLITTALVILFTIFGGLGVRAEIETIETNVTTDYWQYWQNGTPNTRQTGSLFLLSPNYNSIPTFDIRDGQIILVFEPTLPDGFSGLPRITTATLTVWSDASANWDAPGTTNSLWGSPAQIELFATGFGPNYDEATWDGTQQYVGSPVSFVSTSNVDRDPFPRDLVTDHTVEDNVTTHNPWALGTVENYIKGGMTEAFPIRFEFDTLDPSIQTELHADLLKRKSAWNLSATYIVESVGQPQAGSDYPIIVMQEGVSSRAGSAAPQLTFEVESVELPPTATTTASQDRWIYPFNFTPGFRGSAGLFSTPVPGFNFRDGTMGLRFDTAEVAPAGLAPSLYDIKSVSVRAWHSSGTFFWDTRTTNTIEIFGMGVEDSNTSFTVETWNEFSPYIGMGGAPFPFVPRDPHPLNIDAASTQSNVSELSFTTAWGYGSPTYGVAPGQYTPGVEASEPFPVDIPLNIGNARVLEYVRTSLTRGYMNFVLTSNVVPPPSSPPGPFPNLLTKEFAGPIYAPQLIIEFNQPLEQSSAQTWALYQ